MSGDDERGDEGRAGSTRWLEPAGSPGARALRQALDEAAPPAEDQLARQRVWAGVQTPWSEAQSRPGWFRVTALATGVAAIVAVGVTVLATRALDGPDVMVKAPAPVAEPLPMMGTEIVTAAAAMRHRLARGVDASLAASAALVPGDDTRPPEVKRGRVRFSVPHQAPGRRYSVLAGVYRVAVLGTEFDVSVEATDVSVTVASGVVQVEDAVTGRRIERLAPGESWSSAVGAQATPPALSPPPERPRGPAARAPDHAQALIDARAARRAGDPAQALALYQRLVRAGGPLAESALFEMAAIEHEDLKDPARALRTWQRYRDRYPDGVLRAETDLSVIEVLSRVGQEARALEEARGFLRRYPRSERRGEVARVAGDLARTRGDCRGALALYETAAAASAPAGRDADDAAFGRAVCLTSLRDPRATEAARSYQARFPSGRHSSEVARLGQ